MVKVIFECFEIQNEYQEEMEFPDDITDEEITEEYSQWVWNQIDDRFGWHRVEIEEGRSS